MREFLAFFVFHLFLFFYAGLHLLLVHVPFYQTIKYSLNPLQNPQTDYTLADRGAVPL